MSTFLHDVKFGVRTLLKTPAFSLVALLTLALGIGTNTLIFSVVNSILFRPLPFADPDRLAMIWMTNSRINVMEDWHSYPNFAAYKEQNRTFDALAGFNNRSVILSGDGEPERLVGAWGSHELLPLLGVKPQFGRVFTAEEDRDGSDSVVVLGNGIWKRRFGSDPNVVGKKIILNGTSREIIGVMPAGFGFPQPNTEFWVPMGPDDQTRANRGAIWIQVIGRIKSGVTRDQAQQDMAGIAARLAQEFPANNEGYGVNVVKLHEQTVGRIRPQLFVLLGAVGFVLLIACANVANLLLVRAAGREREIAIRTAMGAGRGQIIRQLLTESTLLALASGALGVLLAVYGLDVLIALSPADTPRLGEIALDSRALFFTVVISVLTGLFFGLAPAFAAMRSTLSDSLKEGGRGATSGARSGRLRSVLVVAEVAMSLVLLVGAGVLIRSFVNLQRTDLGFNPENVLTLRIQLSGERYRENRAASDFYSELERRVARLPGVSSVGAASTIFLSQTPNSSNFTIEGIPEPPPSERVEIPIDSATPVFFRSMGIRLLRGRLFTERDTAESPRVVLINETLAGRFFANQDPIGRRLKYGGTDSNDPWKEIVGVIADTRRTGLENAVRPESWIPHAQRPARGMMVVLRATGQPEQILSSIRAEVRSLDSNVPLFAIRTMDELLGGLLAQRRLTLTLMAIFAGVAVVLAAVGLYGVMAYSVAQRTHEIGIRMALGAQRSDVLRLVVRQGMLLAVIGLVIGAVAAVAVNRVVLASFVYGISPSDPLTFVLIAVLLIGITLFACWLPARRATRTDPLVALRYE